MGELFTIRIVKEDDSEILLENLTDKDTVRILGKAYSSILNEEAIIEFTDDVNVHALELRCFYIA